MQSEKDSGADPPERGDDAVERSLEDFIARANSTLPAPSDNTQPRAKLAEVKKRRGGKPTRPPAEAASTLVVLGSQEPLAEVTEIVQRVPTAEHLAAPERHGPGWKVVLAFVAGAAVVLAITKLLTAGPKPQPPAPPPPAVVVTPVVTPAPVPRPVVEPIPAAELPPPVEAKPEPVAAAPAPAPAPARPAVHGKPRPRPAKAPADDKPARGLINPFAN